MTFLLWMTNDSVGHRRKLHRMLVAVHVGEAQLSGR
jgi:hypothetical protein